MLRRQFRKGFDKSEIVQQLRPQLLARFPCRLDDGGHLLIHIDEPLPDLIRTDFIFFKISQKHLALMLQGNHILQDRVVEIAG